VRIALARAGSIGRGEIEVDRRRLASRQSSAGTRPATPRVFLVSLTWHKARTSPGGQIKTMFGGGWCVGSFSFNPFAPVVHELGDPTGGCGKAHGPWREAKPKAEPHNLSPGYLCLAQSSKERHQS
jgi:hypothetical protein